MQLLRAILAGVITAAGSLGAAATDGRITLSEWLIAVGATAAAVGAAAGVNIVAARQAARVK